MLSSNINKPRIVLEALIQGQMVEFEGRKCRLFKPGEEVQLSDGSFGSVEAGKYWLGMEVYNFPAGKFAGYIGWEMELTDFIARCDRMTDEELLGIAANVALTKINRRR